MCLENGDGRELPGITNREGKNMFERRFYEKI
jgi:hypothetical protein